MIDSLNKPNPFHETLPAPEIWHRRMPPYFPFGETPFMEREISRQIEEDLARGKHHRIPALPAIHSGKAFLLTLTRHGRKPPSAAKERRHPEARRQLCDRRRGCREEHFQPSEAAPKVPFALGLTTCERS